MKTTLLFLALCAGLALDVAGGSQRSPAVRKPQRTQPPRGSLLSSDTQSQRDKYEEGIKNLLVPYCKGDINCEFLVSTTAIFCGVPSQSEYCQSDCKFLLEYLWDETFSKNRPNIEDLKEFVPDACAPTITDKNSLKESAPCDDVADDENGMCKEIDFIAPWHHEAQKHNRFHVGFVYDEDEGLQNVNAELKSVDLSNVTCTDPDQPSTHLLPGQITKKSCSAEFPYQTGEIWGVCLGTGHIFYSNEKCHNDFVTLDKDVVESVRGKNVMLKSGNIDPKTVFEDGATFLNDVASFLENDKIKDFLPIAEKIASTLGPIGMAFQLVAFFLPSSDPNHDAIMAQFKKMEHSTEELKNAVNRIPNMFKKELFDARIEKMVADLKYLELDIEMYSKQKTDSFLDKVVQSCANFPGDKFISDIAEIFDAKSPKYISEIYGYGRGKITHTLGKPLLVYAVRAVAAASKCLGLNKKTTADDTKFLASKLETKTMLIQKKINYIVDDWIPNNAMAEWIDNDVNEFMEKNKGAGNQKLADDLGSYLNKKYDFFQYSVGVAKKTDDSNKNGHSTKCFKCGGAENSGMFYFDKLYDKAVYIIYSNAHIQASDSMFKKIFAEYCAKIYSCKFLKIDASKLADFLTGYRIGFRNAVVCANCEIKTSVSSTTKLFTNFASKYYFEDEVAMVTQ